MKKIILSILIILILIVSILITYYKLKPVSTFSSSLQASNEISTSPTSVGESLDNPEHIVVVLNSNKQKKEENTSLPLEENSNKDTTNDSKESKTNNSTTSPNTSPSVPKQEASSPSVQKPAVTQNKYYIKVNYLENVVNIYTYDENGNYTVPVKAMVCSTGTSTPTSDVYPTKLKWEWLGLFGNVYGHYVTQINGNILFHSVPYLSKSPDTLEYWEYDKLGTSASLGCVRLQVADAKWIYDNISKGTSVEFYASSDPGPLGKPTAQKISGNERCRNWDPTDVNPNNPWNLRTDEESIYFTSNDIVVTNEY